MSTTVNTKIVIRNNYNAETGVTRDVEVEAQSVWTFVPKAYRKYVDATCSFCKTTARLDGLVFSHCGNYQEPAPEQIVRLFNAWRPDYSAPVHTKNANTPIRL